MACSATNKKLMQVVLYKGEKAYGYIYYYSATI
jgi:hypothetical protein